MVNIIQEWTKKDDEKLSSIINDRGGTVADVMVALGRTEKAIRKRMTLLRREGIEFKTARTGNSSGAWTDKIPSSLAPYPWNMGKFEDDPRAVKSCGGPPVFIPHCVNLCRSLYGGSL